MGKRKVGALEKIDADFASLQYKIRRDPRSYEDEFQRQYEQYVSQRDLFLSAPANASIEQTRAFHDLVDLLAHVADCYPEALRTFPDDLAAVLTQHHAVLHPELRDKIVGSLGLLRRKDILDSPTFAQTLFPILVHTPSKTLRTLLFKRILSDLRNVNSRTKNHKLNRTVQTVLFNLVTSDRTSARPIWAVKLTRELWTRQVWTDGRPVEIMREACLGDNEKVVVSAVRFFLGGDKAREELEDDDSEDENKYGGVLGGGGGGPVDLKKLKQSNLHNKKSKKNAKRYGKAVDKVKKMERKKGAPHALNFSALHLLHAPQDFAEALFARHLQSAKCKFALESKLQILQLITRLHGLHKLIVLPLFSWFTKYLTPRQPSVTTILASLAQAVHDEVPPDALEPLVSKIANEFVSEASAAEVASAGLAAIREVALRQPLALNETLLQDLVLLRKSKDKSVMMAARGLMSLYRIVGAEMLAKKDRGKEASMGLRSGDMKLRKYGEQSAGGIDGIELLEQYKTEEKKRKREAARADKNGKNGKNGEADSDEEEDSDDDSEANSSEWDMSDNSDDSGGWINVSSDDEAEKLPPVKRQRKGGKLTKAVEGVEGAEGAEGVEGVEGEEAKSGDEDEDSGSEEDNEDDGSDDSEHDSDDEAEEVEDAAAAFSKLATTTVLTPADLAKLRELRMEASVDKILGKKVGINSSRYQQAVQNRHADDGLTAEQIELASTLRKSTKEERIAKALDGKPLRDSHQSTQAVRKAKKIEEGKSMTNQEKARKKNIFMTLGKARAKNRRSLVETKKALNAHVQRSKRGGRRGNRD
ncbi:sda1 domain-containing protein [Ophiostoma piceae UAMH 11346]|uniref:Protein SDA1 n=1 Tax=Ophiostoma piceae (strain UAMH 11346) TaxID=1262450 RepID=S3C2B5_OPHP1|nr:sda1 domain-containing protein [Ophiostoma piceae UAMH 11346]